MKCHVFTKQSVMTTINALLIFTLTLVHSASAKPPNDNDGNVYESSSTYLEQSIPLDVPLIITSLHGKFMTTDRDGVVSQEAFSPDHYSVWIIKRGYANKRYLITTTINNARYCLKGSSEVGKLITSKCDKSYLFWQIIPRNNGTFLIMQDYQGHYLSSPMSSVAGKVSLTDKIDAAQQWKITNYTHQNIESASHGTLISAEHVGLDITQHPRSDQLLQKWHLQLGYKPGVYRIQTINGGDEMCIRGEGWDIKNHKRVSNNHVTASLNCYGANLYWRLLPAEKGTFYIRSDLTNLNLTVSVADKEPDMQLILTSPTTNSNQKWRMKEVE